MAGETKPSATPGTFINDIEAGVRQDYSARLAAARKQVREATDRAETITDVIAAQPFAELDEAELELVVTSLLAALLPIG